MGGVLWSNLGKRYITTSQLQGANAITQHCACLSVEKAGQLINSGYGKKLDIDKFLEEINRMVISNVNKNSRRLEMR